MLEDELSVGIMPFFRVMCWCGRNVRNV